jgi:hypothetical protein
MRWFATLPVLCLLIVLLGAPSWAASVEQSEPHITLGTSTVPLTGPWRFHIGDDQRWAAPAFNDASWESVDLTAAPDAHDGDVGLPGYVVGWGQRGHRDYTGFAWYRLSVTVDGGHPVALAAPTLVDSTYELYVDGVRLGTSGDFSRPVPSVYGVRPTMFMLPGSAPGEPRTYHLAFRVWMDSLDAGPENGGIHVAPTLGTVDAIAQLHQVQWLKTFVGYVADAVEPLAFTILAIMVMVLRVPGGGERGRWLAVALLLLAALRINQVLFYWTQWLSLHAYDFLVTVLLRPLVLAAWVLAWRDWFDVARQRWVLPAVVVCTVAYVILAWLGRPWTIAAPGVASVADSAITVIRLAFALFYVWVVALGVGRTRAWGGYVDALAAVLIGIGIFATEVNALGIPGIWFPFGVGVARGQYAYAGAIVVIFVLLMARSRHQSINGPSRQVPQGTRRT